MDDTFNLEINNKFLEIELKLGVDYFTDETKVYTHGLNSNIFDYLNFNDDHVFNDPILVSSRFMHHDEVDFDILSLMFGYIDSKKIKDRNASLYFNNYGIAFLPNYGYLKTKKSFFSALFNKSKNLLTDTDSCSIDFEFIPSLMCHNVEVFQSIHPIIKNTSTFSSEEDISDKRTFELANSHFNSIKKAFEIIKDNLSEYYNLLALVARGIVLFDRKGLISYATLSSRGTAFINVKEGDDLVFFIEEIIHQFGHNILYGLITVDDYFKMDCNTPMKNLTGEKNDSRTLYSAFHGLYTTTTIADGFYKLFQNHSIFNETQLFELTARFFYNKKRLNTGIQLVDKKECFHTKGIDLLNHLYSTCTNIYNRFSDRIVDQLNFQDQQFVYDHTVFLSYNEYNKQVILEMLKEELKEVNCR